MVEASLWLRRLGVKMECWCCRATQRDGEFPFVEVDANAAWRSQRCALGGYYVYLRSIGVTISPLLHSPDMRLEYFAIACLHALDLGFAFDCIGNFFWVLI